MSRTRKSAWSLASGMIFSAVSLCAGVLATPWLLYWLGSERFGTYRVLLDWFGYLALLELGLNASLLALLAPVIGRGDGDAIRNLLTTALRTHLWLTLAMVAGGLGMVAALPQLISLEVLSPGELQTAWLILLAVLLLNPLSVFRAFAEARQQAYIVNILLTMQSILLTGLLLVAAWAGWGLTGQSIATVAAYVPAILILTWHGVRMCPGVWSGSHNDIAAKKLWTLSWPTLVLNVSGRIGLLSDNVIVGWALGPVAVVPFFLTQRLATVAQAQLQNIGNASWAGLVELHSQGLSAIFHQRLIELTRLVSGLSVVALGPIAAYNVHFISLWVGQENFAGHWINLLSCVNIWLWSLFSLWGWPLLGTGNIALWVPYALIFTTINVAVSIAVTFSFGLIGPLLGTLVGFLFVTAWALPRVVDHVFKVSPRKLWGAALAPLFWGLPYAVMVWLIAQSHIPSGWVGLMIEMSLSGLGGLVLWWTLSLSVADRTLWIVRVQGVLGR